MYTVTVLKPDIKIPLHVLINHHFCCCSDLFMSSVDVSGVNSNPPLCLLGNPVCRSNRSLHYFVSVLSKNHSQKEISWWNLQQLFQLKKTRNESRRRKECARGEKDVLMNTNWKQLHLIRLNYSQPPGFETASVSSGVFFMRFLERKVVIEYKQEDYCHIILF